MTEPRKTKLGSRTKELWENPEYRQHMIDAHKGKIHAGSFKKGHKLKNTGRTRFKKGQIGARTGKKNSAEHRMKVSIARRGKPNLKMRGEKNPRWKGGTSRTEDAKIRQSLEYKIWRRAVFERDNWTCIWGGKEHGNKLQADHIKPFCLYPELRFAIDNGRTLCVECHYKTDTYGGKPKTK